MNRRTLKLVPITVALAVPALVASMQPAAAASHVTGKSTRGHVAHVAPGHVSSSKMPVLPLGKLKNYTQVTSSGLTDTAGVQTSGSVTCSSGKVLGGGAVIAGASLSENINSSYPSSDGKTWNVFISNAGTSDGTFTVYADCAKKITNYSVVAGTGVTNTAGAQNSAFVTCPTGTVPLGGGGVGSSFSTAQNINSSLFAGQGWRVDENNGSTSDSAVTAYAVCGKKPTNYAKVVGTPATIGASSQSSATVSCPSGTVILGGGGLSSSGSTSVNLNSTSPSGSTAWRVYENNASTVSTSLTPYAVCATSG